MTQNPFIVGRPVPPESFVGRDDLITIAFDRISTRTDLAVSGGPGMGKTSFLELLASPEVWQEQGHDPGAAVIVLIKCLTIEPFNAHSFWRIILSQIKSKLEGNPEQQADIDILLDKDKVTSADLLQVLRKLGEDNKFLVLLVDDYDVALRRSDRYQEADIEAFLNECRSIANLTEERKYISKIVVSSRPLHELGPKLTPDKSPWYNHYLFQWLKPFTDREVAALLDRGQMTPAIQVAIREIADGNPTLLQNAGYLLYQGELRGYPTFNAFVRDFQDATEHFFKATWELCNELEQTLLMLIALNGLEGRLANKRYALSGIDNIFSQKEIELNALERRGIVKRSEQEGKATYSFASSLMEWWVVKKIENTTETELQKRQKGFLNLMSRKQAEKMTTAIRWLWNHKEELPSILKWISEAIPFS